MVKRIVWVTLGLLVAMLLVVHKLAFLVFFLIFYLPTFGFLWLAAFGLNRYVPAYVRSLLLLVGGVLFFSAFNSWLVGDPFGGVLHDLLIVNRKPNGLGVLDPLIVACILDAWLNYRYLPHAAK
ncbi:hypothetical protein [Hymenobacter perfusus]|uniref:Uncharacterized protein n=1 Tax=Hymenobacter perfusus TaxID=1236770 RepID=A0A3R9PHP5_9BACT|nr:hypothetical protein [Hymenobacter perfusus]RSK38419.1 hypothetical protein EI293_21615 [Hymenobacter perfusus]